MKPRAIKRGLCESRRRFEKEYQLTYGKSARLRQKRGSKATAKTVAVRKLFEERGNA